MDLQQFERNKTMTFGILIYENDNCLYELIRERLSGKYPNAYIGRAGKDDPSVNFKLIKDMCILYDNREFTPPKSGGAQKPIPLFEDNGNGSMIIDMKHIYEKLPGPTADEVESAKGPEDPCDRLRLLISYAYIDERENFIKIASGPMTFDCIHPIRIDLMSGIRMPTPFTPGSTGSLSQLLRACTDKRFRPSMITEYLNPDSSGFLSCGKPENEDDVFDIGINACCRLMDHLRMLCRNDNTGALVVAEGWRVSELTELIKRCDTLHLLLPARMCTEDTGMTKQLGLFRRSLPSGALMTVHYCEDYRKQYESISI